MGLPISKGSISNFNKNAEQILKEMGFEDWAKKQLLKSDLLHADETGINVTETKYWLHGLSNGKVTLYYADPKRGTEAMDRAGVLPNFKGILCHDQWKPYYTYDCDTLFAMLTIKESLSLHTSKMDRNGQKRWPSCWKKLEARSAKVRRRNCLLL